MLKFFALFLLSISLSGLVHGQAKPDPEAAEKLRNMRVRVEDKLGKKLDNVEWERFAELMTKRRGGEKLTDQEMDFLKSRREAWMGGGNDGAVAPVRKFTGLVPLTQLGKKKYKGEIGGLYGNGSNKPDARLAKAAKTALDEVKPRDANGKPSSDGKVVLISIGMSNTTHEFSFFKSTADTDKAKSSNLVIVDGAQGGKDAEAWVNSIGEKGETPWTVLADRLKQAGVTPAQVQVAWIKHALARPDRYGEFPGHARKLQQDIETTIQELKKNYPNLQVAYLSSRIYAGYASTPLNPEPYAYEGAFGVRKVIEAQSGQAPVALWGPYLWADGVKGRKLDNLVWKREDLREDGTHPSDSGRQKVTDQLLKFFKTDKGAKVWFTGK